MERQLLGASREIPHTAVASDAASRRAKSHSLFAAKRPSVLALALSTIRLCPSNIGPRTTMSHKNKTTQLAARVAPRPPTADRNAKCEGRRESSGATPANQATLRLNLARRGEEAGQRMSKTFQPACLPGTESSNAVA